MASRWVVKQKRWGAWAAHFAMVLAVAVLSAGALIHAAEARPVQSSIVVDAVTGEIVSASNADAQTYPASLTKMMTLYIVFELMEQGRLSPATRIRVSEDATEVSPTKLGLKAGSDIALEDAVKALIVKSANDMAVAVAEHIAGDTDKFAALMTRKAHQLGMTNTVFKNPHGLPDSGQHTTARDMLTLALHLNDDFPQHYKLFSLKSFTYGGVSYRNHNTMLSSYEGMDGIKTGYTGSSGFNLVASVRRNGKHVVAIVMGGSSAAARNVYMRAILDRALPKASHEKTRKPVAIARAETKSRAASARLEATPNLIEQPRPAAPPLVAKAAPPIAVQRVHHVDVTPSPSEPAAPKVEIARVRPVAVAPRPRPLPAAKPEVASVEPRAPEPARAAVEPPPPIVAPARYAAASLAPAATHPAPAHPAPAGELRGTPPSSLQAQADRLSRGEGPVGAGGKAGGSFAVAGAAPPSGTLSRLNGPAHGALGGGVAIQVGAYANEADAQRQLESVRGKASALLGKAEPRTEPVQSGAKQLWRARFIGLDDRAALDACNDLRRQQVDCHVTKLH